jgi:hypothetical protein
MATIKKLIQSATRMRGVTPVPNGPLVKKKGPFKGSTLKKGGMIKRADGSVSQHGLWDSIRENKGSGKKPTAEMLKQEKKIKQAKNGAWQRKEGKNPEGGLNAKGRASYNRETGGHLKAPQPEGGSRKKSFCARMSGMKKKLTSAKTANDPNSRINKSLRKWKC